MGRVLEALRLLQPRQQNSGAGAIQADQVGRDLRVSHQTHHAPVTHVHVVNHHYYPSGAQAPMAQRQAPSGEPAAGPGATAQAATLIERPGKADGVDAGGMSWKTLYRSRKPMTNAQMQEAALHVQAAAEPPAHGAKQAELHELLSRMPHHRRTVVDRFMKREFSTSDVMQLDAYQSFRVRRYAEQVLDSWAPARSGTNDSPFL